MKDVNETEETLQAVVCSFALGHVRRLNSQAMLTSLDSGRFIRDKIQSIHIGKTKSTSTQM